MWGVATGFISSTKEEVPFRCRTTYGKSLFYASYVEMGWLPEDEVQSVLHHCHASTYGGHFGAEKTVGKVLQVGFYWSIMFKDGWSFVLTCDRCQRTGNVCKRYEMSQQGILKVELFAVWVIDFMCHFPPSCNNLYILVAVDYFFKWVEAITTPTNTANVVIKFLKKNIYKVWHAKSSLKRQWDAFLQQTPS